MKKLIFVLLFTCIPIFAQTTKLIEYFDSNQDVMLLINPKSGSIIKANKSASIFYGYTLEELENMKIQDINTFTISQIKDEMKLAKEENRNYFIFNHKLSNQKIVKVHVHSVPIIYKDNEVLFSIIRNSNNPEIIKQFNERLNEQVRLQTKKIEKTQKLITKIFSIGFLLLVLFVAYLIYILIQKKKLADSLFIINKKLKQSENLLIESNKKFTSLYHGSPDMYVSVSPSDGTIKLCNDTLLEKTGFSYNEIIGKSVFALYHDNCIHEVKKTFNEFLSKGVVKDKELILKKKDGGKIVVSLNVNAIKDENGKILYSMSSFRDITEQKRIELELERKKEIILIQSKQASLGEMIGNIAHQWRQPLSAISTAATGMMMQKKIGTLDDEHFDKICDLINKNTQYLSKTIDDLGNYIKDEKKLIEFNLNTVLGDFLNLVSSSAKKHAITTILNTDANIKIKGSPNELIQCFMNIFNNAKDALLKNELKEKYIFIDVHIDNEIVIIKFRDNAGGIEDDILSKIFEPYFTTKHKSRGTGLGLYITYNLIVEGLEGCIRVNNIDYNYNKKKYTGAEFIIEIPILR